jgi:hypothetical protein
MESESVFCMQDSTRIGESPQTNTTVVLDSYAERSLGVLCQRFVMLFLISSKASFNLLHEVNRSCPEVRLPLRETFFLFSPKFVSMSPTSNVRVNHFYLSVAPAN